MATICYQSTDSRQKLTRKKRQFAKTTIHFSFRQSDNCTFFLRRRHGCHDLTRPAWLFWSSIVCVYGGSVVQILTKTSSNHRLWVHSCKGFFFSIHPSCLPVLKSWWPKSVTENRRYIRPVPHSRVRQLQKWPSPGPSPSAKCIFSQNSETKSFKVGSQDICNDIESNLQPATGF